MCTWRVNKYCKAASRAVLLLGCELRLKIQGESSSRKGRQYFVLSADYFYFAGRWSKVIIVGIGVTDCGHDEQRVTSLY